ncbi:uncharacterized protein LOC121532561 [Coregonus clupeaformis]|uniref:uncharacterized protein LOC121532561 n=1 Tax=Coregonus clupeaformis TaxID=59861 RepID=UPI001E1C4066|nr:uncharacterized protein LOC121532561 [Coregonus clupeaformis]
MVVSNILRNAQEDLFSSGMNDLETTNPGIALTEERLSSIFSELFRDACESAQEAARRIHHTRSGRGNKSRSGSCSGSSQGSSRSNMPELVECVDAQLSLEHPNVSCSNRSSGSSQGSRRFDLCHQAVEMERVYLQRDTPHSSVSVRELGSVRRAKRRDVHKALTRRICGTATPACLMGLGEEERGSSLILTPQASTSLSDQDKRALEDVCQILTAWVEKMLNRTCNDNYRASVIIQKEEEEELVTSVMTVLHSEPSTSTKAARAAPAQTLEFNPCLDEDEVVPSTSMGAGFLTTTQAAWAAPAQTLEEEVGGADVSEVSTSSLTPTEARQGLLGKIPSLLPGEILIEEDISFRSTPRDTVMSPQTLKLILQGIMRRLEASEFPQAMMANDPFRLMKNLFVEVQHALKYADISVLFSLEESIQFRGKMQ